MSQHSLIHVLLIWTTILSLTQVVFIIIFFTTGHHGKLQFQNRSIDARGSPMQFQANNPTSPPPENSFLSCKGKMLTFMGREANNKIEWIAKNPDLGLVSGGHTLKITEDGYYFLTLQVTLSECNLTPNRNSKTLCPTSGSVSLMLYTSREDLKVILMGAINTNTCSTGLLGKVVELSAGHKLEVTIDSATRCVDSNESLTHLDFIFMAKPPLQP